MQQRVHRPLGVAVLAIVLALNGAASLLMATDLAIFGPARSPHAADLPTAVALVAGLLLLLKAYGLWTLHWRAWALTIILLFADGLAAVWALLVGIGDLSVWVSLALAVASILYLLQPSVRQLFARSRSDR